MTGMRGSLQRRDKRMALKCSAGARSKGHAALEAHAHQLLMAIHATPIVHSSSTRLPRCLPTAISWNRPKTRPPCSCRQIREIADEGRTQLTITNAGRYWANHGGYFAFLRDEPPPGGGGGRGRNPELEAMRMTFMRLRLSTFWWGFGMSIASFILSLISLAVALYFGDRFFR